MQADSITMPPELLDKARRAAQKEDTSVSELVQTAVRHYLVTNEKRNAALEQLRARAKEMGITTEEQVVELVHEWRREQARRT